ncbi:antileukoproteinase-like isoform X2 [Sorex fumeus]|uniref:antileukoproteinase-like isoform X2 n=1 Tax=Sorex fumeus TaxID=62283 RepID=UPI0024AD6A7B|nr:antileukoproteinase-like isoform X2 [Sorex fumeus]
MKSISLFPLVVLLLGTLASWTVEGAQNSKKAGKCPPVNSVRCFRYEEPQCQSDWQCSGNQKCCQDVCGIKCVDPMELPTQARKKPGKCPQVYGECMMINPPNHCETDSQCQGKLKCCKGMCGKACVNPVRERFSKGLRW